MGADAAKAAGIVVFILSLIFVIGIAIIWWIIKFFINRSKAKKAAEAQKAAEAKAAEVQKVEEAPKQEAEETPKQEA